MFFSDSGWVAVEVEIKMALQYCRAAHSEPDLPHAAAVLGAARTAINHDGSTTTENANPWAGHPSSRNNASP